MLGIHEANFEIAQQHFFTNLLSCKKILIFFNFEVEICQRY